MIRVNEQFKSVIIIVIEVAFYSEQARSLLTQCIERRNGIEVDPFVAVVNRKITLTTFHLYYVPYLAAGIHRTLGGRASPPEPNVLLTATLSRLFTLVFIQLYTNKYVEHLEKRSVPSLSLPPCRRLVYAYTSEALLLFDTSVCAFYRDMTEFGRIGRRR